MQPVTAPGRITQPPDLSTEVICRNVLFSPGFKSCQQIEGKIPQGLVFDQRKPIVSRRGLLRLKTSCRKTELIQIGTHAKGTAQARPDTDVKAFFVRRRARLPLDSGAESGLRRFVVSTVCERGIGICTQFDLCTAQHTVPAIIGIPALSEKNHRAK